MARSQVLVLLLGVLLGAGVAFVVGDRGSERVLPTFEPRSQDGVVEAAAALSEAAARLEAAADRLIATPQHIQSAPAERRAVPAADASGSLDRIEALIDRLEQVAALRSERATTAPSAWDVGAIRTSWHAVGGTRDDAVVRVVRAYAAADEATRDRMEHQDYAFSSAADVVAEFGRPAALYPHDGILTMNYEVGDGRGGLADGESAELNVQLVDGFVYHVYAQLHVQHR